MNLIAALEFKALLSKMDLSIQLERSLGQCLMRNLWICESLEKSDVRIKDLRSLEKSLMRRSRIWEGLETSMNKSESRESGVF